MPYTFIERRRIHRRAQKLVGIKPKQGAQDHFTFIQQCMSDMLDGGETDDALEAQQICELLYEEEQDLGD